MADIKWTDFDVETGTTGARVAILYPDAGSPTGYKNATVVITDFFDTIQDLIDAAEARITTNEGDILDLQSQTSKRLDTSKTSLYSFTQVADSTITDVYFKGTGTVFVGTTPTPGGELAESALITGGLRHDKITFTDGYTAAPRTVYVGVSGGNVDVAIFSKLTLFS